MNYPKEEVCDYDGYRDCQHGWDCDLPTDDGTMQENVDELAESVVGHRIVDASQRDVKKYDWSDTYTTKALVLTLDNGKQVILRDTDDCCAYTELEEFLLHPDKIDHIITGVGTTDGFQKWHIYADFGDVMELKVGWSCGNPFYYAYGFDIEVVELDAR